jgi:hypothetical protein
MPLLSSVNPLKTLAIPALCRVRRIPHGHTKSLEIAIFMVAVLLLERYDLFLILLLCLAGQANRLQRV